MTQRRRFFPSTPVQTVPGRSVEFEMQVRPAGVVTAPAPTAPAPEKPEPVPASATWLLPQAIVLTPWHEGDWALDPSEEGAPFYDFWMRHYDNNYDFKAKWKGTPHTLDQPNGPPLPSADFVCYEVTTSANYENLKGLGNVFFGVLQGTTLSDVHWELEWDRSSGFDAVDTRYTVSVDGDRASTWGNIVMVILEPSTGWGVDGESADLKLTATAYSAGIEVAKLTFVAQKEAY